MVGLRIGTSETNPFGQLIGQPETQMNTKIAVIQRPPVLLDRQRTIDQVLAQIDEAAGHGASLLVFPEAYIPGYPTWDLEASSRRGHGGFQRNPRAPAAKLC